MGKRKQKRAAGRAGGGAAVSLPAVDALTDMPAIGDFRIDDVQTAAYREFRAGAERADELELGVVVRLDRGFPLVAIEGGALRAEHDVSFAKHRGPEEDAAPLLPAVGDAVAVRVDTGHDMGVIECVLPRRTEFSRWRGGARGERQVLAANVDAVLVVQALGSGRDAHVLLDRVARSLVLAADCGAEPVVVLTKADRCSEDELEETLSGIHELGGAGIRVVVTSSAEGRGLDEVRVCVAPGTCAMILGESGAGKSTLLNALLGHEFLATGAVRARDDAGRHTTVARVMVKLPGDAGVVCDAPGLRSLPLIGHERGLARVFPDVVEAARSCRFGDCTHTHEPGCGVREAVDAGRIAASRADAFLALAREMRVSAQSLDPDIHL